VTSNPTFDRRAFLRRSLQLGTLTTGALAASLTLEGCGDAKSSAPSPTSTTNLGPATSADWSKLAASLSGSLILPANRAYAIDRLLYNSKFVDLRPQGIAYCESADDVSRCLEFATSHDVALTSRSGGHSYGGYSSCEGLVIDVSRMSDVSVDTTTDTATVGAGAQLIDVYNVVGRQGRLLPGGSCPSVGIAGLTLGGGVGVFARRYGLTSDNLRSVSLVTADGHHVKANGHDHSDLLWACQGGGGGNFGVATSFTFNVHAMPEVTLFTMQFPWAAAATMLEAWQQWIGSTPDELWSDCQLFSQGTYGFLAQTNGVYCGSAAALAPLLSSLRALIGTAPSYSFVGSHDYLEAMEIEAGCSGLAIASCHLSSHNPAGQLSRSAFSAKSSYVNAAMTHAQAQSMVAAIENLQSHAPTLGGALAFDSYGGAINRVASDETAFVHRDKVAGIQATYSWGTYTPASEIDAGQAWLTWLGAEIFDPTTGAYQNYIDPTLSDWQSAYYGKNLKRLVKVKNKYDPDNHFSFAQSIPTSLPRR
jgi:hypothetical protein